MASLILPPSVSAEDAKKFAIETYVAVGSVGALIWDVIIHLPQDFKLATQYRINISFIVYCISRISGLAYILGVVLTSTSPIGDCSGIKKVNFIYTIAVPSTLLLFVFRVCALYHNNKYAIAFFSILWMGLLASSIIMPFGVSGYKIALTGYCVQHNQKFAFALVNLPPFLHDTIIFLATSWAFIINSYQGLSFKNGLKRLLFGNLLPAFSKTILRDGQFYYLSTLLLNLTVIIVYQLHSPWLPSCTFAIPLFVLMNTLAGHVYRSIRFKVFMDHTITSSVINNDLRGLGAAPTGASVAVMSSPSSNHDAHKLDIIFQRTLTTSAIGGISSHSNESSSEVGGLDLEKGGEV